VCNHSRQGCHDFDGYNAVITGFKITEEAERMDDEHNPGQDTVKVAAFCTVIFAQDTPQSYN